MRTKNLMRIGLLFIILGFYSSWFFTLPAFLLYLFSAQQYKIPFHRFLRKYHYKLIAKADFVKIMSSSSPLIAYPLMVELEFKYDSLKEYVERGHDGYIDFMMVVLEEKFEQLKRIPYKSNLRRPDFEPTGDPETDELMKEAFSDGFREIADDMDTRRIVKIIKKSHKEHFVHKASNKTREGDKYFYPENREWTQEDEDMKRQHIMEHLSLYGNEMGKKVLAEMEEEESQKLVNQANQILGNDEQLNEQL